MKWLKSILVGLVASLVIYLIMMLGINGTGFAPFNIPPSEAFLQVFDINNGPLPLIVHFGYGTFWSVMLLAAYGDEVNIKKGIVLATILWLFLMIVYSPLIGWGFFGFGDASSLDPSAPLYLEEGPKFLIGSYIIHLIYGAIIGLGNKFWAIEAG